MQEIRTQMLARKEFLEELLKRVERKLASAPEGTLRIARKKQHADFYHRLSTSDKCGIYIRRNDNDLAAKLAQKGYDLQLVYAIQNELAAIEAYLAAEPEVLPENVFGQLSSERQAMVIPVLETDEMFVERWLSEPFEGLGFPDEEALFVTDRGERVRSKSELIIANQLAKEGIPYKYECPLYLNGMGTVHPDFTVLNIRLRRIFYWEHKGRMGDPDYVERALRKERAYIRNGIFPGEQLIITSETSECPLDIREVKALIQHHLL